DWAARIVSALAVHATILFTWFFGRRSLGDRPAWWGALVLALAPGFLAMARLLILDGLLTLCLTVAILAAFEAVRHRGDGGGGSGGGNSVERLGYGWWFLSACACGLAVLTKGPVALVLLVPPLWLHARLTGRRALWPGWRAWLAFTVIVVAVAL